MPLLTNLPDKATDDLPLLYATDDKWAAIAAKDLTALLADHAHCEMKAAATGFRLLGSYPERTELVDAMLILVREEMRHFERVRDLLEARGGTLGKSLPDRYVKRLIKGAHRGGSKGMALIDKLIVCGLVEARSCERFRLLAKAELPEAMQRFYHELALAEARHYETFFSLAKQYSEEDIEKRIQEIASLEAEVVASLPHQACIH